MWASLGETQPEPSAAAGMSARPATTMARVESPSASAASRVRVPTGSVHSRGVPALASGKRLSQASSDDQLRLLGSSMPVPAAQVTSMLKVPVARVTR